jgi:type IV pilus assembly protein PilF
MASRRHSKIVRAALMLALASLVGGCVGGAKQSKPKPVVKDAEYSKKMAKSLFAGGRVSEAFKELDEAVARYPDDASLHHVYGVYAFQAARHERAVQALHRALEIDPYLTDAHNVLGAVYIDLKDYMAAEQQLNKVLADPAYPTPQLAYFNLGKLYSEQGRDDEAITALRRAVGIDPEYYPGHFQLASLLDKVGKLIEAASEYEVAEPGYRKDGEYWYRRGFAYYRLGEADKARDSLVRVRSIAPGSESAARADEILSLMD